MNGTLKRGVILLCLLSLAGCKGGLPDALDRLTDDASRDRLARLPAGTRLLISAHGPDGLGVLPELGDMGRVLGQLNGAALMELDRRRAADLGEIVGVRRLVLWGDESAATRLDPLLRSELLGTLHDPDGESAELEVIGTFAAGDDVIPLILAEYGLSVPAGRARAGVATFAAPVGVILELLNDERVQQLKKPALLGRR